jgi:hydrogenase/urease accessory protein HupE
MCTERNRSGGGGLDGLTAVRAYGSPVLFAAVLFVMAGDVVTTAVGLQFGLQEGNPLVSQVIAWFGLPGMLATKALAAGALLVLPALTPESRWTFRVGSAVYILVGMLVLVSNLLSIWSVVG